MKIEYLGGILLAIILCLYYFLHVENGHHETSIPNSPKQQPTTPNPINNALRDFKQ
jgi:hypothetical protein